MAALHHYTTARALASRRLACPVTVCVHIHRLWGCDDFDQTLHNVLHVSVVTLCGMQDCPSRMLQAAQGMCSFLAGVQQLSHCLSVDGSALVFQLQQGCCRRYPALAWHSQMFRILQSQQNSYISWVLRTCPCRVATTCVTITLSRKKM